MEVSSRIALPNRLREEREQRNWRQCDVADQLGTAVVTVQRWERGKQQPSAYFRLKLCALFGKSAEELGLRNPAQPLPSIPAEDAVVVRTSASRADVFSLWTVPFTRNPYFTGRDDILGQLTCLLSFHEQENPSPLRQVRLTQTLAIKGLGGIGKTQIAVEYAYRAREQGRYTHILWINAATRETLMTSFRMLAELLPSFPAQGEADQQKLTAAMKRWLEACPQRWLLIFDNVEERALVQPFCPTEGNGHLLLTTRLNATGSFASALVVEKMGLREGTQLLLDRAQRQDASDEEQNEAMNIVIAIDGLPLALDQAGAYLEETGCSFADYLHLYHTHRQALLARRGHQTTHYPDSVATTWLISFQRLEQANPAAADLLRLCAYLAPDRIPEAFLQQGRAHWPALLQQATADPLLFDRMCEDLLAFSLVKRFPEQHLLSVHRLVQAVQLDQMEPDVRHLWAQRVVRAMHEAFPADPEAIATWPRCLQYLEQVQACQMLIEQYHVQLVEGASVLNRAGRYLQRHASYHLAASLYQQALALYEHVLGSHHPHVATCLRDLADLSFAQGQYAEAEPLFQRALSIYTQQSTPTQLDLAICLDHLAFLFSTQGKYEEAESLFQRALRIYEQHGSESHASEMISILINLGYLSFTRGQYAEAESLYRRALSICEQHLGPHHLDLATCLNALGKLSRTQGRYEEAESLYVRALPIYEQHLGLDHPELATNLTNLAALYTVREKYEEAEPLYQRALSIYEQRMGPQHPYTASALNNVASLYRMQGKDEEAEPLYQRALQIREQQLGVQHHFTAQSLTNLGALFCAQGKYEQAEHLHQRALHILEEALGLDHPETAEVMQNLARLREVQGNGEEARSWYTRALAVRVQALGAHHPKTIETRQSLITLLHVLGEDRQLTT